MGRHRPELYLSGDSAWRTANQEGRPPLPDLDSRPSTLAFRAAHRRGASMSRHDRKNENLVPLRSHETSARDLIGFRHLLETEYMRLPDDAHAALEQVERMKYWLEQMIAAGGYAK